MIARRYEPVDDPADVLREDDGTWRIRAGALVRIRIDLIAPSPRSHLAMVEPLPAGFELLNRDVATTASTPLDPDSSTPGWYLRLDHQNNRDDRAEAFASDLPAGAWTWTCLARATTPGTFGVPGSRAEEMYAPETFGRGPADVVIVADDP